MRRDELTAWAGRWLEDHDALRPWGTSAPPEGMTVEQAYGLQGEVARLREGRGERVIGYKVGCTSRAIRDQLGIREPIFARVFDTACFPSASRIAHACFAHLAIEGELAIRLSRDVTRAPLSDDEAIEAIASVFPVIELHDHVLPAGGNALAALIASGGMNAGLVLPARETMCRGQIPLVTGLDVAIDDGHAGRTREPWTMGGPAATLRWLAARLSKWGVSLREGQVILTGSPLPLFSVGPGRRVVAEARPIGMSTVAID
jgi:2-keto-4-pentenoate hydratase